MCRDQAESVGSWLRHVTGFILHVNVKIISLVPITIAYIQNIIILYLYGAFPKRSQRSNKSKQLTV